MDIEGGACQVCKLPKSQILCPACCKNLVFPEKARGKVEAARRRKAELENRLQQALAQQKPFLEQEAQFKAAQAALRLAKAKCSQLWSRRDEGKRFWEYPETSVSIRLEVHQKRSSSSEYSRSLTEELAKVKEAHRIHNRDTKEELKPRRFHCLVLEKQLREELCKHVRLLLDILPLALRPADASSSSRSTPQEISLASPSVSICGCQLPASFPAAAASGASHQLLGTGLGYLTLLLRELTSLLMAPSMVHFRYRASTSALCMPQSFWEKQPTKRTKALRLFLAEPLANPPVAHTSPTAASGRALSSIRRRWPWESAFKSSASATPSRSSAMRQRGELVVAVNQLMRIAATIRNDQSLHFQPRLPANWSPFAAVAGLCLQLAAEPLSDVGQNLTASFAVKQLARSSRGGICLGSFTSTGGASYEEDDGWDLVQRPGGVQSARLHAMRLPPTPSDGDELITHWERAMITDSSSGQHQTIHPTPFGLPQKLQPLRQGARAAADRLLQGFKPRALA